jgi:hypothetical protein
MTDIEEQSAVVTEGEGPRTFAEHGEYPLEDGTGRSDEILVAHTEPADA